MVLDNKESQDKLEQDLDKAFKKCKRSVSGFLVGRYRITFIILFLIVFLGFFAIFTMPKEAEPEIRVPFAVVSVGYPGANPSDVEELVTDKLEEKIKNLEKIKSYESSSGVGYASIFVEFAAEADIKDSVQKLNDAVDEAKPELPEEANDPQVKEINFNDFSIVTYSLLGNYSDVELKSIAEIIQDEIEEIKDVSKASIIGGVEREFQILVDQTKLANYGLSISSVVNSLSATNFNLPAGEIEIDQFEYTVRVKGQFEQFNDLNEVVISYVNETPIYIRDIAEIKNTYKEKNAYSRIMVKGDERKNTISINVYKRTGGNILNIVEATEEKIQNLKDNKVIPESLTVLKTQDNSVFIKDDINRLGKSGLQTMVLIIILLLAVLGIRGSIITGISVPIAFLIAFIVLMIQGMTINSMVLFSLVLSLGLMVDNAIIVMEGINEYLYDHKKTPFQAAILSIWNYKWPIISGTMTTVSAFLPMLLVSGIMGEYMGILPKTISATLVASLFVALVIIPTLSARFYKRLKKEDDGKKKNIHRFRNLINRFKIHYEKVLNKLIRSKKMRRLSILTAIILLFVTIALPITGVMRVEMFPSIDIDYFIINVELPVGSSLEKTSEKMLEVESIVAEIPELDNYVSYVGMGYSIMPGSSGGSGSHVGSLVVNLVDIENRERKSYEITEDIRPKAEAVQGATVRVQELSAGPPTGAPVEVRVKGPELKQLAILSHEVEGVLAQIEDVINIENSLETSSGEFTYNIDREKVKYYGLTVSQVAMSIRQAIYGVEATTVTLNGEDIDITVKYDKEEFTTADDLQNILLFTPQGHPVEISELADLTIEPSVLSISHREGEKTIVVTADIDKDGDLRQVLATFNEEVKTINLPDKYNISVGGEVEDIEQSYTEMFLSMILAVFLILFILVMQFNSFKQSFVIIFSLPLAIVGAFVGLTILRLPFSLPAFIGIVSLSGIVVNDSIVLIDRINKNLKRGMEFFDGVVEAGIARMQPIFLTSITTIAGVLPLALSEEMWAGLGFSIIFGLLFATVLTLVFIPIVYTSLWKKTHDKRLAKLEDLKKKTNQSTI